MKKTYFIAPTLAFVGFGIYYAHWQGEEAARQALIASDPIGAYYVGRDGRKDAETDLAAGHPKYLIYGEPDWRIEGELARRFSDWGIQLHRVTGCELTLPVVMYVAGYNRVIEKKYGRAKLRGVFDEVRQKREPTARGNEP